MNETTTSEDLWFTSKPMYQWENPWVKIGIDNDKNKTPLYIKHAFETVIEHASNMKLIYNQQYMACS